MAKLMKMLQPLQSEYVDRRFDGTKEEYFKQLELSSTLYIGNMSFYTTEDQVYELFGKVGVVRRVIMGLDRHNKTPCGFCFVIYHTRADALRAVQYLNGTKLDNRQLRVDIDYGFEEGRQYGRGRSGGQVRDEFRTDYDADRGGYGRVVAQQLVSQQMAMWQEVQAGAALGQGMLPAAAGGAVFFGQSQREQPRQPQQGAAGEDGQQEAAADGGGEDVRAMVNPRMAGRGQDEDDEEDYGRGGDDQHPAKRRRMDDGTAAGASEHAAAGEEAADEQEAAADEADDSADDATDAAAATAMEEAEEEEEDDEQPADEVEDNPFSDQDEGPGGDD